MEIINNLNKYSLTTNNINIITKKYNYCNDETKNTRKKSCNNDYRKQKYYGNLEKKKIKPSIYFIKETDKLFWIFYILLNDYDEYQQINNIFKEEMKLKYKCINYIQESQEKFKDKIRKNKLKINDAITDLGNQKKITMDTFKILCIFYYINIAIKKNKLIEYYYNETQEEDNHKDTEIKFYLINEYIDLFTDKITLNTIQKEYITVKSLNKPLKSITYYKLDELQRMAEKLDINSFINGKKKKKKELYQEINTILS